MTSFTFINICNLALTALGADRIVSLADAGKPAQACLAFYDHTVEEVLQSFPWPRVIRRVELARIAAEPLMQWLYQYQLPNDCIRVWELFDSEGATGYPWVREGMLILTNMTTAYIRYTQNITDTSVYDPLLRSAIAYRLAYHIAYNLTQSRGIQTEQLRQYSLIEHEAKMANATEGEETADADGITESQEWGAR